MSSKPRSKPKYDFRTCLKKSEVLKPDVLEKWLADHPNQKPAEDATQLIRENLLTEWQAKYLLSGRYRLHLGNYQLLRRVRRDSFGDRFIALHPQLGRTVQVQVLPVELTNAPQQRAEFLKQAGLAGELDHPNLAHVLDIDKQQGRYYLVTEHTPGKSLSELSERTDKSLDASKIGRMVVDSISGLAYAHSRSVVHGNLSMDNLLIDEHGQVKISQLALSPLVEHASDAPKESVTPEQGDLLAIVRLSRRMLNHVEPTVATRQLSNLLSNLNTKESDAFAEALDRLKDWIDAEPELLKTETRESAEKGQGEAVTPAIGLDPEIERLANNAQLTNRQKSKSSRKTRTRSGGPKNPLVRGGALALLTLIVGIIGYFSYQAFQKPKNTSVAIERRTTVRADVDSASSNSINNKSLSSAIGAAEPSLNSEAKDEPSSTPSRKLEPARNRSLFPESTNSKLVDPEFSNDSDKSADLNEMQPRGKLSAVAVSEATQSNSRENAKTAEKAVEKPVSDPIDPEQRMTLRERNDPDLAIADKTTTKNKPKQAADPEQAEPTGPFDGFPVSADLPPTTSVDYATLAEIKQHSIHLLGMELRSPEGIGKGRTNFALLRNETNKQQWSLIEKKTPRNDGNPVGEFEFDKPTGQLKFRWLPEAANSKAANYARNCVIKLTLANESRTVALRTPLSLPDLKLTRKQPFAQLDSAIEWLPNPELITIELLPSKSAGLPKTWLEPAIVQPGIPSAIHFHEAISNRFMWLQLKADIRSKLTFDLTLMLKHADGTVQPISRSGDLKKLATLLLEASAAAQEEYLTKKDLVAPYGQKTKFKDYVAKLKSTAKKTQKQAEIAAQNITIIENFYDRVIPVRVIFRSDDHHVVLIDTAPNAAEEDSNE